MDILLPKTQYLIAGGFEVGITSLISTDVATLYFIWVWVQCWITMPIISIPLDNQSLIQPWAKNQSIHHESSNLDLFSKHQMQPLQEQPPNSFQVCLDTPPFTSSTTLRHANIPTRVRAVIGLSHVRRWSLKLNIANWTSQCDQEISAFSRTVSSSSLAQLMTRDIHLLVACQALADFTCTLSSNCTEMCRYLLVLLPLPLVAAASRTETGHPMDPAHHETFGAKGTFESAAKGAAPRCRGLGLKWLIAFLTQLNLIRHLDSVPWVTAPCTCDWR